MKLVKSNSVFLFDKTTKLLWKMKQWNKMRDGFCLRDFNLLFESRQHNTDV